MEFGSAARFGRYCNYLNSLFKRYIDNVTPHPEKIKAIISFRQVRDTWRLCDFEAALLWLDRHGKKAEWEELPIRFPEIFKNAKAEIAECVEAALRGYYFCNAGFPELLAEFIGDYPHQADQRGVLGEIRAAQPFLRGRAELQVLAWSELRPRIDRNGPHLRVYPLGENRS